MDYIPLGDTGLEVSELCLGCGTFGQTSGWEWGLPREESLPILERAIDLGINFFDTANQYASGESERIVGEALDGHTEDCVINSKVYFPTTERPNSGGLSRKAIQHHLDASRSRLGVDTIDLYQLHRWDDDTPIEVTLRTLDDAVSQGKIRYVGACSMWAHQLARAVYTSRRLGIEEVRTMQSHYNLVYREKEREVFPFCQTEGIATMAWSPLARGFLARPHQQGKATERGEKDEYLDRRMEHYRGGGGVTINERVEELATEYDASMAQISLAWLLHQDHLTVPIVGVSSVEHLEQAVEALEIDLSESDLAYLEEPYEPTVILGHD
jgi:aryl-alcohol dehydrogenase-like predicted oxidoreductase